MIVDCLSDLHGFYPELEGGDLLIVAGDHTKNDWSSSTLEFLSWLQWQRYKKKFFIAGNHDNWLSDVRTNKFEEMGFTYLCDSGTEFEYEEPSSTVWGAREGPLGIVPYEKKMLKIWGSPWSCQFDGINPKCCAFTGKNDKDIANKWSLIPSDVDILITHTPPFTIRDMTVDRMQVGSPSLLAEHVMRLRPRLWVFGHIHEAYGEDGPYEWNETKYVNASHVNERYEPVNKPIRVIL